MPSSAPHRLTPTTIALLLLPPLLWAGNAVVGRMMQGVVPPITLNFMRWVLALLLLLPLAGWVLLRARSRCGFGEDAVHGGHERF